jgi:hypothetical protein
MTSVLRSVDDLQLRKDTIRLQSKHRKRLQRALDKAQLRNIENIEQVRVRKKADYHAEYAQLLACYSGKSLGTFGLIVAKTKMQEDLLNAAVSGAVSTTGVKNNIPHNQHKLWMYKETEVVERYMKLTNSQLLRHRVLIARVLNLCV